MAKKAAKSRQPSPAGQQTHQQIRQQTPTESVGGGEYREMPRSMLHEASYNPRSIDQYAARGLRENLRRVKLVQPVVWNQRTGTIVAGHQRLSQCDVLMNGQDYLVPTIVVDWDEKTEKEQNVALNNPNIQGVWDIDKLDALIHEPEFDFANAGFDLVSLEETYLAAGRDAPIFDDLFASEGQEELDAIAAESESLKNEAMAEEAAQLEEEKIAEIKEAKKKFKQRAAYQQEAAFYFIMAFPTNVSCAEFLRACNVDPINEVQYGPRIAENLGIRLQSLESQPEQVQPEQAPPEQDQPENPEPEST